MYNMFMYFLLYTRQMYVIESGGNLFKENLAQNNPKVHPKSTNTHIMKNWFRIIPLSYRLKFFPNLLALLYDDVIFLFMRRLLMICFREIFCWSLIYHLSGLLIKLQKLCYGNQLRNHLHYVIECSRWDWEKVTHFLKNLVQNYIFKTI